MTATPFQYIHPQGPNLWCPLTTSVCAALVRFCVIVMYERVTLVLLRVTILLMPTVLWGSVVEEAGGAAQVLQGREHILPCLRHEGRGMMSWSIMSLYHDYLRTMNAQTPPECCVLCTWYRLVCWYSGTVA